MKAGSTKSMAVGLVVGLIIGLAVGYIIVEQEVGRLEAKIERQEAAISRLESQIAERDSLINIFYSRMKETGLISSSGKAIVDTMFTLTDLDGHRDFFADLKKDEVTHVQIHVMGAPINFYINKGTLNLIQKTETLSEEFAWTVPEEGRYVFRTELKGYEYALVALRIAPWRIMLGGGTAGQEKVTIEAVEYDGTTIAVYAVNTDEGPDVVITGAILRDSSGSAIEQIPIAVTAGTLRPGILTRIPCAFTSLTTGETYTVALVSSKGNQFVSPSFKV